VPVVSTSIGSEGLHGDQDGSILLADGAVQFAQAMVRVASDSELAQQLVDRGYVRWEVGFSPERIAQVVVDVATRARAAAVGG
jgi:hypothetical protein